MWRCTRLPKCPLLNAYVLLQLQHSLKDFKQDAGCNCSYNASLLRQRTLVLLFCSMERWTTLAYGHKAAAHRTTLALIIQHLHNFETHQKYYDWHKHHWVSWPCSICSRSTPQLCLERTNTPSISSENAIKQQYLCQCWAPVHCCPCQ